MQGPKIESVNYLICPLILLVKCECIVNNHYTGRFVEIRPRSYCMYILMSRIKSWRPTHITSTETSNILLFFSRCLLAQATMFFLVQSCICNGRHDRIKTIVPNKQRSKTTTIANYYENSNTQRTVPRTTSNHGVIVNKSIRTCDENCSTNLSRCTINGIK